ncbi:MAG: sensor histidine kinase [Saprospiraceae bacterium]
MTTTGKWLALSTGLIKMGMIFGITFAISVLVLWPWMSHNLYALLVNAIYNSLFTMLLWVGNEWLAENIHISWVEYPLKRLAVSAVLTVVYTLAVIVGVRIGMAWFLYGTLPSETLEDIGGDTVVVTLTMTLLISTFLHGRAFLFQWKESLLEAEQLKRAHLTAKYENLKTQVNPHFLFNSLNVLSNLVYKDQDQAVRFIKQLSNVYRYLLDMREQEVVSLETELEVLKDYISLLKIRFGESLNINLTLESDAGIAIPPLTLQMLVENAVKHNIASKNLPLDISIFRQGDQIVVENNLQSRLNNPESTGIGLINIQERYRHVSDKVVAIENGPHTFRVILPVLQMAKV